MLKKNNFNSIKVRLKLKNTMQIEIIIQFQFHKGTIKTNYERSHQSWTYISIP